MTDLPPEAPPPEPKNWFLRQWHDHGTKIMGFVLVLFGAVEYIDEKTINMVGGVLGPVWGPRFTLATHIIAGLTIAWRGYTNSLRNKQ